MEGERRPIVLHDDEGRTEVAQVKRVIKADGRLTDGRLSLAVVTGGLDFAGPARHRHLRNDEAFIVLEGELRFLIGDEEVDVGPGAFLYAPAGVTHAFTNRGGTTTKMIVMFCPADFEGYFQELAALRAEGTRSPEKVAALQRKYGMEVVGPPLGANDA